MVKVCQTYEVQWDGQITLAALTQRLHDGGHGREALAAILEHRDRELVSELCGPRNHPHSAGRYRRASTRQRILITRFGRLEVATTRVRDSREGRTFVPLWEEVLIEQQRQYQLDLIWLAIHLVERCTYRNARDELQRCTGAAPSAMTLNRRVIELGATLLEQVHQRSLRAVAHEGDGTKVHSQRRGGPGLRHHEVRLVVTLPRRGRPKVRSLTVGPSWQVHRPMLERTICRDARGQPLVPAAVVDLERGLHEALTPGGGPWQACHVHAIKAVGYALWKDGLTKGEDKRRIMRKVASLLAHLRSSVLLHLPKGERVAIEHRIEETTMRLKQLSTELVNKGLLRASSTVWDISVAVTTFATLALEGITIPWHTNLIERLMGAIAARFKHRWMSWTTAGAQALLILLVMRTLEPKEHRRWWDRQLFAGRETLPNLGVTLTTRAVES